MQPIQWQQQTMMSISFETRIRLGLNWMKTSTTLRYLESFERRSSRLSLITRSSRSCRLSLAVASDSPSSELERKKLSGKEPMKSMKNAPRR